MFHLEISYYGKDIDWHIIINILYLSILKLCCFWGAFDLHSTLIQFYWHKLLIVIIFVEKISWKKNFLLWKIYWLTHYHQHLNLSMLKLFCFWGAFDLHSTPIQFYWNKLILTYCHNFRGKEISYRGKDVDWHIIINILNLSILKLCCFWGAFDLHSTLIQFYWHKLIFTYCHKFPNIS